MKKLVKYLIPSGAFLAPALVFAQDAPIQIGNSINEVSTGIGQLFNIIAPVLIAVVVIYLLYGAFVFATAGGDEEKRERGKNILLYGLIGVFLLVSIIGLINFVISSFTIGNGDPIDVPDVTGNIAQ